MARGWLTEIVKGRSLGNYAPLMGLNSPHLAPGLWGKLPHDGYSLNIYLAAGAKIA